MCLVLLTPTPGAYEWYALAATSSVQQQRTSTFCGSQGVTAGSDVWWGFGIGHEARWAVGIVGGGVD